jgi:hypothetical protein
MGLAAVSCDFFVFWKGVLLHCRVAHSSPKFSSRLHKRQVGSSFSVAKTGPSPLTEPERRYRLLDAEPASARRPPTANADVFRRLLGSCRGRGNFTGAFNVPVVSGARGNR